MAKGGSTRLKEQNRLQLWLVIVANAVVFLGAAQWAKIELSGFRAAVEDAAKFLPAGLAVIVATVANGLLSSAMKDRLVFLRWKQALPGHRAFSVHAASDPRIDPARLKKARGNKLPADPEAENRLWYRCTATTCSCATMPGWPPSFWWGWGSLTSSWWRARKPWACTSPSCSSNS